MVILPRRRLRRLKTLQSRLVEEAAKTESLEQAIKAMRESEGLLYSPPDEDGRRPKFQCAAERGFRAKGNSVDLLRNQIVANW
eukprot:6133480-Karenia_brevis.AAC.1